MGNHCCNRAKEQLVLQDSDSQNSELEDCTQHHESKHTLNMPVSATDQILELSQFNQSEKNPDLRTIQYNLSNPKPLQYPFQAKYSSINLVSSNCSYSLIKMIKSRKKLNLPFIQSLRDRQIPKKLLKALRLENEQIQSWALYALYIISKQVIIKEQNFSQFLGLNQILLCDKISASLKSSSDLSRLLTLKIFSLLSSIGKKHQDILIKIIDSMILFENIIIFRKYLEKMLLLLKTNEKIIDIVDHPNILHQLQQTMNVRVMQRLKILITPANYHIYLQSKFFLLKITFIFEIHHCPYIQVDQTVQSMIDEISQMETARLLSLISDKTRVNPFFNRRDLFPISCIGTMAVIALIQDVKDLDLVPSNILQSETLFDNILQNLVSEHRDLAQYTVLFCSYIFSQPFDDSVSAENKVKIIQAISKLIGNQIEEIRYICGLIVRNLYVGDPHFFSLHSKIYKKMIKNVAGFENPKFLINNLMNIKELMIDEQGEYEQYGIRIMAEVNIWKCMAIIEHVLVRKENLVLVKTLKDDIFLIRLFLSKSKSLADRSNQSASLKYLMNILNSQQDQYSCCGFVIVDSIKLLRQLFYIITQTISVIINNPWLLDLQTKYTKIRLHFDAPHRRFSNQHLQASKLCRQLQQIKRSSLTDWPLLLPEQSIAG